MFNNRTVGRIMTFIKMGFEGMIDHKGSIHNLAGVKVRTEKK